jgi:ribosomal protein S18 acetylase RimI-like enzyme
MATLPGRLLYERFGFTVIEETEILLPDGVRLAAAAMEKPIR